MKLIYDIEDLSVERSPTASGAWTAIIPAAGRGSRLGTDQPKILYPILGRTILEWLSELLKPLCREVVFVLSPEGAPLLQPKLSSLLGTRAQVVLQENPTGMADAITLGEAHLRTPYTLVLWGDQVTARARTIAACMTLLESSPAIQATMPTIERESPYIHFIRDKNDRIVKVYEARESDQRLPRGESDCGIFLFRTASLLRVLCATRGDPAFRGAKTKENNFLSLMPLFHDAEGSLVTVRIHDIAETVGVNTTADAREAGEILERRSW